ncbi:uncharacterized protein C11orf74 homolog [Sinocyclocheilus grahami]|uniref:uncharacterized protein C11orf74 homolog n=1 Tax=Sinocyclocheilus grahami TaxID=75366 RepID=UPI0007AD6595|nr:PREDICTED: uncharacterized protein C11orf74 homolog [Sinocyclocheilus grahami]
MPGLVNGSVVDDHDQGITEALEQFCNFTEQTYEQFLFTFTYLTPENVRDPQLTAPRGHGDTSQREMDSSQKQQREDEVTKMEESVYRRMGQTNRCSPTADQEEVMLDGGCVGGRLSGPSRSAPDRPVKAHVHCQTRRHTLPVQLRIRVGSHLAKAQLGSVGLAAFMRPPSTVGKRATWGLSTSVSWDLVPDQSS